MADLSLSNAKYLCTEVKAEKLPPTDAEICFVGRSNVGKSSLLNALCRRKGLARVSQTPGRTRAINVFEVARARWLVDLPGYGYATGPEAERRTWRAMIENYLTSRPSLTRVFVLIDAKVGPTALDRQMAAWSASVALPVAFVANKTDQVPSSRRLARRKELARELGVAVDELFWTSALKLTGIDELRACAIESLSRPQNHA